MNLAIAVCSITATQRRRYFWAAWWTEAPQEQPFRAPDAAEGGYATLEDALLAAEQRAGRYLALIEPYWARAWTRVMRGERAPPRRVARSAPRPQPRSSWDVLGLAAGAPVAEIKAAYRRLALATHPDHGGDADAFRELQQAYERLLSR